jgi:uncharacterized membrane protein
MKHKHIWLSSATYIVIAVVVGMILRDGLIIFLGFNILLATIPYVLSILFLKAYEEKRKKIVLYVLAIMFVLFFPNTFYVLTDVIHFQESQFFERYPDLYHVILKEWIGLFIIMYGVFQATFLGVFSLKHMTSIIKHDKVKVGAVLTVCSLSSIGIFIGRFLRLNSWQFYRIDLIFQGMIESFSFFMGFVVIMTLLQIIIYILTTSVFKAEL